MKDSVDRTVGVVDDQGYVIACSELAAIGSRVEDFRVNLVDSVSHELVTAGRTYVLLSSESGQLGYAAFVDGTDSVAKTVCAISAVAFDEALANYEEKHRPGRKFAQKEEINWRKACPNAKYFVISHGFF